MISAKNDSKVILRQIGEEVFRQALQECSVANAFRSKVSEGLDEVLHLAGGEDLVLRGVKRIVIIAIGKGAATMLEALLAYRVVTNGREVCGILVSPHRPEHLREGIAYFAGGHPSPNAESVKAAKATLELLREAAQNPAGVFCFFLISGGASAMVELSLDEAVSLDDLIGFHRALVHSGGSISEINAVRKHFSAVKGGRLAQAAGEMRSLTFAVSDVPVGRLDVLASGPTLPDTSTVEECRAVITKYGLMEQFPPAVRAYFEGELEETPKPGELHAQVYSLLSSADLAEAARVSLERRGFRTLIDNSCDDWEYREAAQYLLPKARLLAGEAGRSAVITAGEVTVQLPAKRASLHGHGGRNQQFALYCALQLKAGEEIAIVSAGSDGIDGNSPATGAAVDRSTIEGKEAEARRALEEFDSFEFLDEAGATIVTGPTGNNLRDLRLLLV